MIVVVMLPHQHSPQTNAISPGFANEKKIDHLSVILEVLISLNLLCALC